MTLKVDGTNGVLQAYDYQVLTTGFSYTFAAGTQTLIANPAGTLATGTVTMPASPADGMVINIQSTQQITALTVAANTGQTLVGGTVTLRQNQPLSFMYRLSNTTWYPFAGNSNSDIVSGVTQASTSGTAITFSSIPSWVKRITVMFNGVSSASTSYLLTQIGSGSMATSGYASTMTAITNASPVTVNITGYGFLSGTFQLAGQNYSGMAVLTTLGSNIWTCSVNTSDTISARNCFGSGSITLGGTLDQLRVIFSTTGSPVDTFDAGSINILYE